MLRWIEKREEGSEKMTDKETCGVRKFKLVREHALTFIWGNISPIIMAHALKRPISFLRVTLSLDPLWSPPESNIFCCSVFAQFLRFVSVPSICAAVQENGICIRARSHIAGWCRTQGSHACAELLQPASRKINRLSCALARARLPAPRGCEWVLDT